jgi:hypothetical protein
LNTVNKRSKQSCTATSKQKNSESTPQVTKDSEESTCRVKIVEDNQSQKDGSKKNQLKTLCNITRIPPTHPDKLHNQHRMCVLEKCGF